MKVKIRALLRAIPANKALKKAQKRPQEDQVTAVVYDGLTRNKK